MDSGSPYTKEFFQFVQDHLHEDPAQLLFKYHTTAVPDLKDAVQQISARNKAKHKLPSWLDHPKVIFPPSTSLEQASSEITAKFKAGFMQGSTLADLTGGFGIDAFFLGEKFVKVTFLEKQSNLVAIVAWNFAQLGRSEKYCILNEDCLDYLNTTGEIFDWIYLDPARRGKQNQKLFQLEDCEPDVVSNWNLFKGRAHNIMVKVSPMMDLKAIIKRLPGINRLVVLAIKNEVKEVLVILEKNSTVSEVKITCCNLKSGTEELFEFDFGQEANLPVPESTVKKFLVEPNVTILKAGAFNSFGNRYNLSKLSANSHFYTSEFFDNEVPGRYFEVVKPIKATKNSIKLHFPKGIVNVIARNYVMSAGELKKRYRLKDGGEDFLIATSSANGRGILLWCKKKEPWRTMAPG